MGDLSSRDPGRILQLARKDPAAAGEALSKLATEEQLALICDAPVGRRAELLALLPAPEALIPLLPEAELCFTVKAVGIESADWLLEHATPEQIVAALDLDVWHGHLPERMDLDRWLDVLAETSDDSLLRSMQAIDPELVVHYLRGRVGVVQKPNDDEGWEPPDSAQTLDGQFYFFALHEGDDLGAILRLLHLLFQRDYWTYFRMLQGVIWELDSDNLEWALRWRRGRLEDLGFPPWEEAMRLYNFVPPARRAALDEGDRPFDVNEWHLPVWIPSFPAEAESRHLFFRAVALLEPEERRAAFYAFVAVANKVAVADRMDLADVETTPHAIEKAALWISRGLEHVASENQIDAAEVLRRTGLERLFRVGANLDPEAARPPPPDSDS